MDSGLLLLLFFKKRLINAKIGFKNIDQVLCYSRTPLMETCALTRIWEKPGKMYLYIVHPECQSDSLQAQHNKAFDLSSLTSVLQVVELTAWDLPASNTSPLHTSTHTHHSWSISAPSFKETLHYRTDSEESRGSKQGPPAFQNCCPTKEFHLSKGSEDAGMEEKTYMSTSWEEQAARARERQGVRIQLRYFLCSTLWTEWKHWSLPDLLAPERPSTPPPCLRHGNGPKPRD